MHPDPALRDLQAHALKRNLSVAVTGQPCLGAQGSADRPSWERRGPPSLGLPGAAQGPGCSRLCVSRPPLRPHLALTATESDGTPLMEQYVPCPVCEASRAQHADAGDRAEAVQYFDMEDCVLTAVEWDFISCPRHPDLPVPLQELVPELFMTDFPARYAAAQPPSRPRRLSGPRPRLPGRGGGPSHEQGAPLSPASLRKGVLPSLQARSHLSASADPLTAALRLGVWNPDVCGVCLCRSKLTAGETGCRTRNTLVAPPHREPARNPGAR